MAIKIKAPDIEADEVEITEILVKVSDKVGAEQSLITVEGDKASMEALSPQAGIARKIKTSVGDKTQTGALIIIFDSADGAADVVSVQAGEKKEAAPAAVPVTIVAKGVNVSDVDSSEVEVAEVLVKVGDKVEAEWLLITVENDKASMEVPTPLISTAKEIRVNVGDKVSAGSLITAFEAAGEAGAAVPAIKQETAPAVAPVPAAGVEGVNVPNVGNDETEVTEVMMKVGDRVAVEQSLITVEGDKASMEVPAPLAGVVKGLKANTDDKVKIGSLITIFEVEGTAPVAAPAKQEAAAPAPTAKAEAPAAALTAKAGGKSEFAENDAYVHATPLIRRLVREFDVGPTKVKGIGRKGRILHEGVQAYVKEAIKRAEAAPVAIGGGIPDMLPWPKVDFDKFGEIEEMELDHIQKISSVNLSRNWVTIPHVTHFDKTDITELEVFRKQQNEEAAKHKLDVKITPVAFIMKAVVVALEQMPHLSSSLLEGGRRLTLKEYINIGVTVDTPNGLAVPAFKDVNKRGIIGLSHGLMTISKKARDDKLAVDEMQGGCFTISSIGGLGTTYLAPIMNAPEVIILGASKSAMEPVWNGKEFVPRLMLPISLSSDRRVIDGTDGVRFIIIINNILFDIRRLVTQVREPVQRPTFL